MFFFFGGVDTNYKTLQHGFGPCVVPSCVDRGCRVDLVEASHRLNAFFIPLWTFSRKELVRCESCGYTAHLQTYENHKAALLSQKYGALPTAPVTIVQGFPTPNQHPIAKAVPVVVSKCVYCGTQQQSGWAFCPHCGHESNIQKKNKF